MALSRDAAVFLEPVELCVTTVLKPTDYFL